MCFVAICFPQCKNNGICIEPGTCSCPENFVGPYCEHEKKLCLTRPTVPHNAKLTCSSTSCTINCAKGYIFPDGSSITNMICNEGEWKPSRSDQTVIPDCQREIYSNVISIKHVHLLTKGFVVNEFFTMRIEI